MKKNKVISLIIVLIVSMSFANCFAQAEIGNDTEKFEVIYIPYEIDYNSNDSIKARYKDTKEPITLSECYDGRLYATVPKENADREIEAFSASPKEFSDYSNEKPEFYTILKLSETDVITGNENNEALPFENITKAEAAAMITRFLGLETDENYELPFNDVSKDDWFYSAVAAVNKAGIMEAFTNSFLPHANITREEFAVITKNLIEYSGLIFPYDGVNDEYFNPADKDKISDWAKEAYDKLGRLVVSDYENTESEQPAYILKPQKNVTRYEAVQILNLISGNCLIYPSQSAQQFGFDKEMPVIDGSTSTYPFTQAVYSSLFFNGDKHPAKPEKHSKSHASYQRLINGEVDLIFASVYPASDILALAEEKGVELELIPIAYDAMIFFTNAENPAEGLTSEQINNIYVNDAYENWNEVGGPDALLYPYCRNNDSGSHAQMEKHFLNGNEINEKIQKETTSESMSNVLTDVMDAKTDNPLGYGLGYSIYYYFNNMDVLYDTKTNLKLLAVDGVFPNDETIADGSYPLSNNTYVVLRKDTPLDSPARKMADFMLTEAGQDCVERAGFGRLK